MDRNKKFLKLLTLKEFREVQTVLNKIYREDTRDLDIKRLTRYKDVYRVRVRSVRIIFLADKNKTEILEISRRSEKTYRNF